MPIRHLRTIEGLPDGKERKPSAKVAVFVVVQIEELKSVIDVGSSAAWTSAVFGWHPVLPNGQQATFQNSFTYGTESRALVSRQ